MAISIIGAILGGLLYQMYLQNKRQQQGYQPSAPAKGLKKLFYLVLWIILFLLFPVGVGIGSIIFILGRLMNNHQ